jgi:hypothetical protein
MKNISSKPKLFWSDLLFKKLKFNKSSKHENYIWNPIHMWANDIGHIS